MMVECGPKIEVADQKGKSAIKFSAPLVLDIIRNSNR